MNYTRQEYQPEEIYEYLRKSRSDDPLLSVEEVLQKHELILDDYARKHFGRSVPEENIFREIASSETIDGRPEMLRLLNGIESPRIHAVLVVEVQRLSRGDLEDAGRLIKLLRYTNTCVITPQKTYNLNDEYDRDIFERELKRGNEYLEYFKKIQSRGRLESVREGNYIGSIPPYGYDKVFIKDGRRKCPVLKINESQAEVVRMIFDLYANQDMGRTRICHQLDELGLMPPRGEHWSPAALKDMLSNVHYIGKVKWNWRKTVTIVEDQEIIKTRPKAKDYLIFEGKHEAIISEELFRKAQEKQGRNHRAKASSKLRNPLAGILFCRCGRAMSLRTYKKDNLERSAPRLLCDGQVYCGTGSALYSEIIDMICNILENCIEEFTIKMKNDNKNAAKIHQSMIHSLENKMKDLEKKELLQWEAQSDPNPENRMPQHIFKTLNAKLLAEKELLQKAIDNAYASVPEVIDYEEKIARFSEALNALKDPDVEPAIKNKYLKNVFKKIIYYREKPVRLSDSNRQHYGIKELKTGGNWHSSEIELNIIFK